MSNSGSSDSINLDLIDLDSSSSGEFYEPTSVLRRARDTIEQTDELLGQLGIF